MSRIFALGAVLVALALASPAGLTAGSDSAERDKTDRSTIGAAPQFLTTAELKKIEAIRLVAPAARQTPAVSALLSPKTVSFSTVLPGSASNSALDLTKPSRAPLETKPLTSPQPGRKSPEQSTREPAAPGLTAAEIAKREALNRKTPTKPVPGRSDQ